MASPFYWPVLVPSALRAPAPVNLGVSPLLLSVASARSILCTPRSSHFGSTVHAGAFELGKAAFLATQSLLECKCHTPAKAKLAVRPKGGQRTTVFMARSCLATLA